MIGENVEFKTRDKAWAKHPNGDGYYDYVKSKGKVLDKISEVHGRVSPGWVHSKGSNNVAVSETSTYYMIADDKGKVHRVHPSDVCCVLEFNLYK